MSRCLALPLRMISWLQTKKARERRLAFSSKQGWKETVLLISYSCLPYYFIR